MVEAYKATFIDFLLGRQFLKLDGPYEVFNGRMSPYYLKFDDVNDGDGLIQLGDSYAETILANMRQEDFDGIVGIPSKCHTFGPATITSLARRGVNRSYSSWRDVEKTYGFVSSSSDEIEDRQRRFLIGARIPDNSRQVILDDVITAGASKEKALDRLRYLTRNVKVTGLVVAANRQEFDNWGEDAIKAFTNRHGIPVYFSITASDIFDHLKITSRLDPEHENKFLAYFRAWGTPELRKKYLLQSRHVIDGKTIIIACDVDDIKSFEQLVKQTSDMSDIGGYKLGFQLGLLHTLSYAVDVVRKYAPGKKIIYDHQKGGTDTPHTARNFSSTMKKAGVDAAILFPLTGPITQVSWTGELLQEGIEVFIGGEMTHPGFLQSEGGYIADDALERIYSLGARMGVVNFIVPGTKFDRIGYYRKLIEDTGITPSFGSTGFITQGGKISEASKAAGENFHAIIGRDIINSKNQRERIEELASQL